MPLNIADDQFFLNVYQQTMDILKGLLNNVDVDYTETTFDTVLGPTTLGAEIFVSLTHCQPMFLTIS